MKVKRTYRLRVATVEAVRYLVENRRLAATQDCLVDMAIQDLAMAARHADEARGYETDRGDPELAAEAAALARDFEPLEAESWPN